MIWGGEKRNDACVFLSGKAERKKKDARTHLINDPINIYLQYLELRTVCSL